LKNNVETLKYRIDENVENNNAKKELTVQE
jgi:hypothetical protein